MVAKMLVILNFPQTSLFLPPEISVTHFALPGVPLDAPASLV